MAFSVGVTESSHPTQWILWGGFSLRFNRGSLISSLWKAREFMTLLNSTIGETPIEKKGDRERNRTSPNQWIPSQYSFLPAGNLIEKISYPLTLRQGRFQRGSHIPLSPSTTIIQTHQSFVKSFSQFFLPPKERILNLLSIFFLFSTFLVFSVRIQTHS